MPDPAAFASPPMALGPTAVTMQSVAGADASGPVEYLFTETTGNFGGVPSGWQTNPSFTATGLLPGTRYAYTVAMRDALGNTGTASAPVEVVLPSQPPGPQLVIAWHTPDPTPENTAVHDSTPDVALPGVTGTLSGGRDAWTSFNSTDLGYGSLTAPPAPLGANGVRIRTTGSENLLTLALTNGSGADLALGSFHFDFGGFDAGPRDFQLVYLSGDLDDPDGTTIGGGSRGGGSTATADYADYDQPLAPALSDTTLAPGESASFQLIFSNASSETTASGVDNVALTSAAAAGPDRDADGIPDADEDQWDLDPADPADAALDRDGDGSNNLVEILAGTSPDDAGDFPRLGIRGPTTDIVRIDVPQLVDGRVYILEHSPDLAANGRWTAVGAVTATQVTAGEPHLFQQPASGPTGFYRVRIEWASPG
jgi:hypothetical protein